MSLIEREALLEVLDKYVNPMPEDSGNGFLSGIATAISCIEDAPTIDAAPVVHGRVLDNGNPICGPCSVCGESTNRRARYCSMCGAWMDGGKDDG